MAALYQSPPEELVGVGPLAKSTGAPTNYLSKILHTLGRAGMVEAVRGPGGGFRIPARLRRITAYEIVRLFDDVDGQRRCFLGNKTCSADQACPAHQMWSGVWDRYEAFLRKMTLDRLAPPVDAKPRTKRAFRKRG